jgi:hypothetical protein
MSTVFVFVGVIDVVLGRALVNYKAVFLSTNLPIASKAVSSSLRPQANEESSCERPAA